MIAGRVSILLPTFNRARFLPAAFAAIEAQLHTDWELIVVDDGSTDDTPTRVGDFATRHPGRVTLVRQANAGPYAARNRALDRATGSLVAFYDSDDIWRPHHLSACVQALGSAPEADWVYAACRMVDHATGRVVAADTFRVGGRPRRFLRLRTRDIGPLRVLADDRTLAFAIEHGLYCGLQNSVIRRAVFAADRFRGHPRNEAEDQLFLIRALRRGVTISYLDDVHVDYHVHDGNSSGSATDRRLSRDLAVYRPVARGFDDLYREFDWTGPARRALRRRLQREHFWHLGYAILWRNGRRDEALAEFRTGLRAWPWSPSCWKTFLLASLRPGSS